MKTIFVLLLTLILSIPALTQSKEVTDKAFLFTLSGLDHISADGYRGGIGFRYTLGNGYWTRAAFAYNGALESNKAQASGGVFKDICQTNNATFSLGAELGSSGDDNNFFGFGGSLLFMAWDDFGISLDEMIVLHMKDDYVATSSGGSLTLNFFF